MAPRGTPAAGRGAPRRPASTGRIRSSGTAPATTRRASPPAPPPPARHPTRPPPTRRPPLGATGAPGPPAAARRPRLGRRRRAARGAGGVAAAGLAGLVRAPPRPHPAGPRPALRRRGRPPARPDRPPDRALPPALSVTGPSVENDLTGSTRP